MTTLPCRRSLQVILREPRRTLGHRTPDCVADHQPLSNRGSSVVRLGAILPTDSAGAAITAVLVRRHKASGSVVTLVAIAVLIVLQHRMLTLSFTDCLCCRLCGNRPVARLVYRLDRRQRLVKVALAVAFFVCAASTRSDVVSALVVVALPGPFSWRLGRRWLTLIGVAPVITLFVNRTLTHAFTDAPYQDFSKTRCSRQPSRHGTASPESLPPDVLAEIDEPATALSQASSSMTDLLGTQTSAGRRRYSVIKGPLHVRPAR